MTTPTDSELHIVIAPQTDPRLGRQVVHDPRSRRFAFQAAEAPRRDITLRVYGPKPRPEQEIGCCTGVDQCVKANTAGNRVKGVVHGMDDAVRLYTRATQLDPWESTYPPDDTGSSGLAACQAAKEFGWIDSFEWIFNGPDGILAALAAGHPVGVGTWWYESMFQVDQDTGLIEVNGPKAGGHQWPIIGYRKRFDAFIGLCWWGPWGFRDTGRFLIPRNNLAELLADDGDSHITRRAQPA